MFKKYLILVSVFLLCSCSAKQVSYTPKPEQNLTVAAKMIEQALYEQHAKFRPQYVFISNDFIGISKGTSSETRGIGIATVHNNLITGLATSKTMTREVSQRIYFNSLSTPKLYTKKGRFIVQIRDINERVLINIGTLSEYKAKKLIDSIMLFILNSYELNSQNTDEKCAPNCQSL